MKILFESTNGRRFTGDPLKFFSVNQIPNGSFVSVGYLIPPKDAHEGSAPTDVFTGGPRSRKYNIPSNDAQLVAYIEQYANTAFANKMEEIRQTPKYQAVLKSGDDNKCVPFDLGECNIIKIGRYNFNWRSEDKNADDWSGRTEKLWDLRRRHGFGKDDSEYDETDWHRKPTYNGTGVMPKLGRVADEDQYDENGDLIEPDAPEFLDNEEVSRRNKNAKWNSPKNGIATYQRTGYGLYAHHDTGRLAMRQQVAQVRPGASRWYFVDEFGGMTELSRECVQWLCSAYKQVRASKKEVEEMEADEAAYVKELTELESLDDMQVKQLLLDRILYIVGATKDADGNREPITYVNDKTICEEYPYLDVTELNMVLAQWVKRSTDDVIDLNESRKSKYMRRLNESEDSNAGYINLMDYFMKNNLIPASATMESAIAKIEKTIAKWGKEQDWEENDVKQIVKYLFSRTFKLIGKNASLKCGSKTYKWTM